MNRINLGPRLALLLLASLGLAQCKSGKSETSRTSIEVRPDRPIVISADATQNGTKITGPWARFFLSMTNNSSQPVTIVAVVGKIYSTSTLTAQEISFDPNTVTGGAQSASTTCTYTSYGTWNPGETKSFTQKNGTTLCDLDPSSFLMSGMEKPSDSDSLYRYRVTLKALGWFGTFD